MFQTMAAMLEVERFEDVDDLRAQCARLRQQQPSSSRL